MGNERVLVVGAGGISGAWFSALVKEKVDVVGVVEQAPDRAAAAIAKHGLACPVFADLRKALRKAKPQLVVDLTPPEAHCTVTCTALRAGCHVLGEKPMAASMPQARRMVAAADRAGRCYAVSQSRRWFPAHQQAKAMLAAGAVGQVTAANCDFYIGAHFGGFRAQMPSPLILDMAIHHFDLARYLTGADPVAVYAKEFNPVGSWFAGDAAASCIFEMTGGVIFTYRGSWCAEGFRTSWNGHWRLVGARGTVILEQDQPPRGQVAEATDKFLAPLTDVAPPPAAATETPKEMHGALVEMLGYLRGGPPPATECHDNIKSLAMVFAAVESSRKGKKVPVRV